MKKKRIAFIVNGGIGGNYKGEGNCWFIELCEEIAKSYELTVFSFVRVVPDFKPKGYQLIGIPFEGYTHVLIRFIYLFFKLIYFCVKYRYTIIHAFWAFPSGTLALMIGKLLGIKTAITVAGGEVTSIPAINYGLFQSGLTKNFIKYTAKYVDVLIAPSHYQSKKLNSALSYRKIVVIPFGIDLAKFPVTEKTLESPYQFIYLGDINKVKDLPTLIKTFQKITQYVDAQLDVLGLDTLDGEIQALAKQMDLSDKVTFHGRQPNRELTTYLRQAHILLHTALSDAQIVAVNEALASGVVVCGTRVGLIDDLENRITLAAPVGDINALVENVLLLIRKPELYNELRLNGIAWSKTHDLTAQSEKYANLYESLLAN
ncbi:glycosyltransferase family 4 protein [Spirosoma sp. KCTC 42546]|uniref:glycosyltransferase family 4 protein n=1 Tax=Spirosoma sp. KCTC 42546 TaxID=2520506 RepID=UPI00115B2D20|nr:glycosyltransferase family 4 protein [Spirosoma sp. KCTC 42546]QDK81073.1 glycosyltransferase family 4 protein [Spirosoma sp. KCTC 42546]